MVQCIAERCCCLFKFRRLIGEKGNSYAGNPRYHRRRSYSSKMRQRLSLPALLERTFTSSCVIFEPGSRLTGVASSYGFPPRGVSFAIIRACCASSRFRGALSLAKASRNSAASFSRAAARSAAALARSFALAIRLSASVAEIYNAITAPPPNTSATKFARESPHMGPRSPLVSFMGQTLWYLRRSGGSVKARMMGLRKIAARRATPCLSKSDNRSSGRKRLLRLRDDLPTS